MGEEASADRGCRTGCLGVGELGGVEDDKLHPGSHTRGWVEGSPRRALQTATSDFTKQAAFEHWPPERKSQSLNRWTKKQRHLARRGSPSP